MATEAAPDASEPVTQVFSPSFRVKAGPVEAISSYLSEIRRDRWQIWMNFMRKFRASYSTTVFGMFWAFALPLVPIGAYTLLANMKVVIQADSMPFIVYIALGVTLYSFVTASMEETMRSLKSQMGLLSRTSIGVFSVILGSFGTVAFETLVRLAAIGVLLVAYQAWPTSLGSLLIVPALFIAFLSMLGVGLVLAILNTIASDIEKLLTVIVRFGVFFSAVFFPMPSSGVAGEIVKWNPLHTYVDGIRQLLVLGRIEAPTPFFATAVVGLLVFVIGVTLFYRCEMHIRSNG